MPWSTPENGFVFPMRLIAPVLVSLSENSIQVLESYVHNGDVNLSSGDIEFNGPVNINGSVDTGAKVITTGKVTISGNIRNGNVITQSDLEVEGGIITSERASIVCGGNLKANFIENSKIYCSGNIEIEKALISSKVCAGKNISILQESGLVAGCSIFLWGVLKTADFGFVSGRETTIHLGSNWKHSQSLEIKQARRDRFAKELEKNKLELRNILRKHRAQMTTKHKEMKKTLHVRVTRLRYLIDRLAKAIFALNNRTKFNKLSAVLIRKTLN